MKAGSNFVLSNGLVEAVISPNGQLLNLYTNSNKDLDVFVKADKTQLTGNNMLLYDDQPLRWDAWDIMDYHLETEQTLNNSVSNNVSKDSQQYRVVFCSFHSNSAVMCTMTQFNWNAS